MSSRPRRTRNKRQAEADDDEDAGDRNDGDRKKAKSGVVGLDDDDDDTSDKRMRHNQVEIRRRQRIKESFTELGEICNCKSKQKRTILATAIQMIREYGDKIQSLKASIEDMGAQPDAAAAATAASVGSVASAASALSSPAPSHPGASALSSSAAGAGAVVGVGSPLGLSTETAENSEVDHGSIFHSSGVPLFIISFDGRILDCNDAFAAVFSRSREIMLAGQSTTIFSLTAPDSLSTAFSTVGALMNSTSSVNTVLNLTSGSGVPKAMKLTAWNVLDATPGASTSKYLMCMVVPLDATVLSQQQQPQ